MAMKTNYVLVDFESVQAHPQVGAQLADEHFRLILFMGANQARIDVALAKALQPLGMAYRTDARGCLPQRGRSPL